MTKTIKILTACLILVFSLQLVFAASITIQTPVYDTSVVKDSTFTVTVPIQASSLSQDITATLTPSGGIGLSCPSTSDCQKTVSQSGGTATFTVKADTAGTKNSPFTISANSGATSATEVTASTSITVSEAPSWSVSLAKSSSSVVSGDLVDFTLSITITSGTLNGATASVTGPSGWTLTSGSISYSLGDLSASTTASWTIRADSPSATNSFTASVTGTNSASKSSSVSVTGPSSSDNGATSSSGGGAGGAAPSLNEEFKEGNILFQGAAGNTIRYMIGGNSHSVKIMAIRPDSVDVLIKSVIINDTIKLGETKSYDVTEDKVADISIKVESISGSTANLIIKDLKYKPKPAAANAEQPQASETPSGQSPVTGATVDSTGQAQQEGKSIKISLWWIVIPSIASALLLLIVMVAMMQKKKQKQ